MDSERIDKLQQSFGILGESDRIKEIVETIDQVARTDITILICGESGTGKEVIANAIYRHSLRKHQPFVKVNCGAIPAGILESELFGHIKGSFTGAVDDRKGYFETANHGTIFLDEIGEMPPETQVKLLRVLELGEFLPVGGSEVRRVDVRVLAATNKDLAVEIERENFRKDLYYRIKTITLNLPPLRKHPEDIPLMVEKFALEFANRNDIVFKGFSPTAIHLLREYSWPGNTRELKNFVESMIVLQKGEVITSSMIEKRLLGERRSISSPHLPMRITKSVDQAERELILQQIMMLRQELREIHDVMASNPLPLKYETRREMEIQNRLPHSQIEEKEYEEQESPEIISNDLINPEMLGKVTLAEVEKELIQRTLKKFNNRKRQAANALRISERTLYRKINEYGLEESK
ncbi:MAG: sigma-54 dependent transcriptional regulator [Candidatus Marinimicrobia bacterium]|jgi:DNA-binding NtrC family response regulator|nr:sigma-54 dependent transcriptional regulator [Candidatus Neomarinimicrobiota bacterium]MCK9483158.1 sigma-54 dependent transcriptional regulator [Candidatus Neomarinimicrobiota bacterium]MCK9559484.1 sigma-54 dependent transcriptional regulator [Candidatus Neomarinimicrobiota bacterium]MDD5061714.1 sigma-54 dependent transcriptional regulator [Candidatus Neomarinimicrobiota bacterium]MDD5230398.1 sigma-54 dependent transcriptional regulator [Candidatus Neomarinimicrobiota bacterium]